MAANMGSVYCHNETAPGRVVTACAPPWPNKQQAEDSVVPGVSVGRALAN